MTNHEIAEAHAEELGATLCIRYKRDFSPLEMKFNAERMEAFRAGVAANLRSQVETFASNEGVRIEPIEVREYSSWDGTQRGMHAYAKVVRD